MIKPSALRHAVGILSEVYNDRNQSLVTESGVLGGDLIPRAFLVNTFKSVQKTLKGIGAENADDVMVNSVGSSRYGAEHRFVFGDIDVILKMEKPETLSQIKQWAIQNGQNVRDIKNKTFGKDLDVEKMGDQFSFLYPIIKPDNSVLTIGELRAILHSRFGSTSWKDHHDERLRVDANLKNIKDKSGVAMVQVDVMRSIVGGTEMQTLVDQGKKLIERLNNSNIVNISKYTAFLSKFLDNSEVEEFNEHYEFLRNHGELKSKEDQQLLTAIYYLKEKSEHKTSVGKKFENISFRYTFHSDALQMIYFIANQLGVTLTDDNFNRETLKILIDNAKKVGIVGDKMTVEALYNPAEAYATLKGKFKEQAKAFILANTKNKRSIESNPDALYNNYGSREIRSL